MSTYQKSRSKLRILGGGESSELLERMKIRPKGFYFHGLHRDLVVGFYNHP